MNARCNPSVSVAPGFRSARYIPEPWLKRERYPHTGTTHQTKSQQPMLQVSNIINVLIENPSRRVNRQKKENHSNKQASNMAICGDSQCRMFYITTLTCTSGYLSTVCRSSQDAMAGWNHRCIPRVRHNSNKRQFNLYPRRCPAEML